MISTRHIKLGYNSLLIFVSIVLLLSLQKHPEKLIWSDMEGYYNYLPATFIYHDFSVDSRRDTAYVQFHPKTGKLLNKYTCGVAIMQSPFFLINHFLVTIFNGNNDGKNYLYGYGIMAAGLSYFWIGIYFLFKFLRRYIGVSYAILSLLSLSLGTNLFYYTFV